MSAMSTRVTSSRQLTASLFMALILVTTTLATFGTPPHVDAAAMMAQPDAAAVRTITRFETSEPVIALTFDAGSDRGYAEQILNILRDKGVRASFGMTGSWAQANGDLITRMHAEGHQLMNHSWDHPSFVSISSTQRADQLKRTADLIRSQVGVPLAPYFRPPYGEYNDSVLTDLAANGYTLNILWTVDTLGWNGYTTDQILQRVLNGAVPGAIMLMHVGAQSQDAAALPQMIDQLRARGFRFATVADFITGSLSDQRYFPETGHWLSHGFLAYWQRYGGLALFGYPLTEEVQKNGLTVQYFERARFEWHPGAWPERMDVLLGRLGMILTDHRQQELPFQPVNARTDANCTFYPETGHRLCFGFRSYWQANGGLAIFGYPISEEFRERNPDTGQTYTVQYFERARFEYHPENAGTPYTVLLGRLGAQTLGMQ
jgi:peptidoglycan/xylan/chitin deacetylase (PgdA/CDA1 family)